MSSQNRDRLNMLSSSTLDAFDDNAEHFEDCATCGQTIDIRRLGDVIYHDTPGHTRLPVH